MFEDGLNRIQRADRRQKLQWRRRIRDELFSLLGWELASPLGVLKRLEERLGDLFRLFPYGFRDEVSNFLVERMTIGMSELRATREKRQNKRELD